MRFFTLDAIQTFIKLCIGGGCMEVVRCYVCIGDCLHKPTFCIRNIEFCPEDNFLPEVNDGKSQVVEMSQSFCSVKSYSLLPRNLGVSITGIFNS